MSTHIDEDDSWRREKVSDEDYRRIDAKLTELKRRLNDRKGSLIYPTTLLESLQCIIEDRVVMPESMIYSVTDGQSDREVIPFTEAQWSALVYLHVSAIGCTHSTWAALTKAYGKMGQFIGHVLLRTSEEILHDCGERALKDLSYCLDMQGLRLPTPQELDAAADWWVELSIPGDKSGMRVARRHLGHVPLAAIRAIDGDWPSKARIEGNVTTLGELLAFDNEQALGDFLVNLHPEWTVDTRESYFREIAQKVAEWVHANDLKLAGDL